MANPMMQMLTQNNLAPMKQAMNMAQAATNPNAMVQQLLSQNPRVQDLIRQNGNDPKKAFYALAQQMGVDPEQFLANLK